jgi:hypothetical protein
MTTKPAVDYRRVLQELIDLWDSELKERTVTVRGDFEHEIVPLAVYSSVAHAVECGKAVLTLYRASLPVPAVPLIRTLIEDSVTAAWLVVAPGAWQAYASAGADERGKTIRRVMKERPEDVVLAERSGEMTSLTEHLGTPKKWRFEQRAAQLEGADDVYTYYRIASALSHAGFGIADLYAKADPRDRNEAILLTYPAHAAASSWIAVAAGAPRPPSRDPADVYRRTHRSQQHNPATRPGRDARERVPRRGAAAADSASTDTRSADELGQEERLRWHHTRTRSPWPYPSSVATIPEKHRLNAPSGGYWRN